MATLRSHVVRFVLPVLCLTAPVFGTAANFTDGNGSGTPDSFPGTAGDGWAGPWLHNSPGTQNGGAVITGNVINTSPMLGGGNYLSAVGQQTTNSAGNASVARQYTNFGTVQLNQPHTISWNFRVDDDLSTFNNVDNNDRYRFYEDRSAQAGTTNTDDWIVMAMGGTFPFANGNNPTNRWMFLSGSPTGNGFANLTWIDTGYDLVSGRIYSFVVNTNPATRTWTATISDDAGSTPFTSPTMNWRNIWEGGGLGGTAQTTSGGFLHWGWNSNSDTDARVFSLDSVSVVPEPASLTLLAAAGTLTLLRRRRA